MNEEIKAYLKEHLSIKNEFSFHQALGEIQLKTTLLIDDEEISHSTDEITETMIDKITR